MNGNILFNCNNDFTTVFFAKLKLPLQFPDYKKSQLDANFNTTAQR